MGVIKDQQRLLLFLFFLWIGSGMSTWEGQHILGDPAREATLRWFAQVQRSDSECIDRMLRSKLPGRRPNVRRFIHIVKGWKETRILSAGNWALHFNRMSSFWFYENITEQINIDSTHLGQMYFTYCPILSCVEYSTKPCGSIVLLNLYLTLL